MTGEEYLREKSTVAKARIEAIKKLGGYCNSAWTRAAGLDTILDMEKNEFNTQLENEINRTTLHTDMGKEGKVVTNNSLFFVSPKSTCHSSWQDTLEEKWLSGRNEEEHYSILDLLVWGDFGVLKWWDQDNSRNINLEPWEKNLSWR